MDMEKTDLSEKFQMLNTLAMEINNQGGDLKLMKSVLLLMKSSDKVQEMLNWLISQRDVTISHQEVLGKALELSQCPTKNSKN